MVFGKYVPLVDRIEDGIHHSFHKNFGPRRATWKRSHHLRGDHQQSGSPFQDEVVGCQVEETPQLGRQPPAQKLANRFTKILTAKIKSELLNTILTGQFLGVISWRSQGVSKSHLTEEYGLIQWL